MGVGTSPLRERLHEHVDPAPGRSGASAPRGCGDRGVVRKARGVVRRVERVGGVARCAESFGALQVAGSDAGGDAVARA